MKRVNQLLKLLLFFISLLLAVSFVYADHCELVPSSNPNPDENRLYCGSAILNESGRVPVDCSGPTITSCSGDYLITKSCKCIIDLSIDITGVCIHDNLRRNCKTTAWGGTCVSDPSPHCEINSPSCKSSKDCPTSFCENNETGNYYLCLYEKCRENRIYCDPPKICRTITYLGGPSVSCDIPCNEDLDCGVPYCSYNYTNVIVNPYCRSDGVCSKDYRQCKKDEVCGSDVNGNPICQGWLSKNGSLLENKQTQIISLFLLLAALVIIIYFAKKVLKKKR